MKRLFSVVFMVLTIMGAKLAYSEPLNIGWEPWAPYQYMDDSGQLTGLDLDLLTAMMEGAGLEYKYFKRPWKRMLAELKAGDIHIAPGASKTQEREAFANFSQPYRSEQAVLLINADKKEKYDGLDNLMDFVAKQHTVGVVREYYYGETYAKISKEDAYKGAFKEVSDDEKNFFKLLNHRVDAMMIDPVAAGVLIKKKGWQGKFHALFTVYSDDIFLMFSKKTVSQETIDKINAALVKMKSDGSHQTILKRYLE